MKISPVPIARHSGRYFGMLCSGSAVSMIGAVNTTVAMPLIALALTQSAFWAGLTVFTGALPKLLLQIPAGFAADRFDRHRMMTWAQAGRFITTAAVGTAILAGICPIQIFIAGVAVEGAFAAAFEIAEVSIITQIVRAQSLDSAVARNEKRNSVATLIGRPAGGVLYALGTGVPFLAATLATGYSIVQLRRIGRSLCLMPIPQEEISTGRWRRAREGIDVLLRDSLLRRTLIICVITNALFQITSLNLIVLAHQHGTSAYYVGFLLAASGAGGMLGSWLAPRILDMAEQPGRTVLWCLLSWTFSLALVLSESPVVWLGGWALVGFTGAQITVMRARHQAASIPAAQLGRVSGFYQFLTQGAVLPCAVLAGGGAIAASSALIIASLVAVCAFGLTAVALLRKWHRLTWEDITREKEQREAEQQPGRTVKSAAPERSVTAPSVGKPDSYEHLGGLVDAHHSDQRVADHGHKPADDIAAGPNGIRAREDGQHGQGTQGDALVPA